jgi:hypothetical protein
MQAPSGQSCGTNVASLLAIASGNGLLFTSLANKVNPNDRALFVWLISYQLAVLFSQNKSATSNQSAVLFSQNKSAPVTSQTNIPLVYWFQITSLLTFLSLITCLVQKIVYNKI